MPMKLLPKSIAYVATDIANMINGSMTKWAFPYSLEFAEVSHLFKIKTPSVSMNHKELNILQAETEVTVQWYYDNAMEANPAKFQGLLLKSNKQASNFRVIIQGQEVEVLKLITVLGIYEI